MHTHYEGFKIWKDHKGYPCIWVAGREVKVHVFVWEKVNGSKPKKHDIHHKDGNKENYNLDNLQLVTPSEHSRIHAGWIINSKNEWIKKPCNACKRILDLDKFYYIYTRNKESNYCRECHNKIQARRRKLPGQKEKHTLYTRKYRLRKKYEQQKTSNRKK